MSMFDPESRNALAAFLASEKNLQPYDAQQRQGRGWLLPVADNPYTGKPGLSHSTLTDFISRIPGSIYDAVTAPGRAYSGQIPQWQDDGQGNARTSDAIGSEALNVAGVAAGGGTVFGRVPKPLPQNAAPMFERRMIPSGEADAAMARALAGPDPVAPRPDRSANPYVMGADYIDDLTYFAKARGRDDTASVVAGQPANDSFTTPFTGDRLLYSNPNKPTPGALAVGAQERQGGRALFGGDLPPGVSVSGNTNSLGQTNYAINAGADNIGHAYVRDIGDAVQVGRVGINDEFQGKGIGRALYGRIERDLGKPLVPDTVLSDSAYSFWQKHRPEAVEGYTKRGHNWVPSDGKPTSSANALVDQLRASGEFYSNPAGAPGGLFAGQQDTNQQSVLASIIQRYLGQ